ncbi:peptidoglycan-binding protein [Leptolyngbya sp. FACHB-16]|uniref:peptidoglycan-binding domain-containing protein n=1 Tax=unclassified Leptolyngbya TaxID=2650499 RepID=UPI001687DDC0|nr:peptidoglycan-binding protein [Leptolyngbya sp. FACHB-16]MBD2157862.1 peptidoglycan-binding protein [Leptolyngbya sp. FACHB-16]
MKTVERIRRVKSHSLDEPLVHSGIPAGRLGNRTFFTESDARQAAIAEANRLNQTVSLGHSIAHNNAHKPGELPHYHVVDPQGNQISGHFFYGKKPYRVKRSRDGNLQQSVMAATQDLNPHLLSWQKEYQELKRILQRGQATRQQKGRFKWLSHKLQSLIPQKRIAHQLGAEIHAARQAKQTAQREYEYEISLQRQWLFELPLTESSEVLGYNTPELESEPEAFTNRLRSPQFRSNPRLQAAANDRPAMRKGERGLAVQKLQQALIDLGFPMPISTRQRGIPDGIYGSETTATVRKFQQKYKLRVDGIVGKDTLSQLDRLFKSAPPVNQEPMCGVPRRAFRRQLGSNLEYENANATIPQPILCLFQNTPGTNHFFNGAENWAQKVRAIAKPTSSACSKIGSTPYKSGTDIVSAIKNASLCLKQKLKEVHIFSHSSPEGVGGVGFCTGLYRKGLKQSNGDKCFALSQGGKFVSDIPTDVLDDNVVFFLHGCRTAEGCGKDINNFARALFNHLAAKLDNPRVYGHRFRTCAGQECNWCEYSKQHPKGQAVLKIPDNLPQIPVPYRIEGMKNNPCKNTKCSLKM